MNSSLKSFSQIELVIAGRSDIVIFICKVCDFRKIPGLFLHENGEPATDIRGFEVKDVILVQDVIQTKIECVDFFMVQYSSGYKVVVTGLLIHRTIPFHIVEHSGELDVRFNLGGKLNEPQFLLVLPVIILMPSSSIICIRDEVHSF